MYLHEDRENFRDIIDQVADATDSAAVVIEKDYYVTLILRLLSDQLDNCVFKGGTSLSKGYHVINRFSEDIDITFDEHIGEARRKKLKNKVLKGISEALNMPITNWDETQSDRDYNAYLFSYTSVFGLEDDKISSAVKLETALGSYSFPTEKISIGNYIGDYLAERNRFDLVKEFMLDEFYMKLQALERTYIDKIFALCDYYLQGKSKRYSRHLYDIYKLSPKMRFDENLEQLYEEVRVHRAGMGICPSAKDGMDVPALITEICDNDFYKEDYHAITNYFADDMIEYQDSINQMRTLAEWIKGFKIGKGGNVYEASYEKTGNDSF